MTDKMKYLLWRNGRPRWSPGPGVRGKGFRGQDLRYPSGEWMRLGDAMNRAKELNDAAGISSEVPAQVADMEQAMETADRSARGYVYFLFSGQRLKVGFSTSPLRRAQTLKTASAMPVEMFCYVPGTYAHEREIHEALRENHIDGEWFYASQKAMNIVLRSIRLRHATADATPL